MFSKIYLIISRIENLFHKIKLRSIILGEKGLNVTISKGFYFINPNNIYLSDHIYIGPDSTIYAHGEVYIKQGSIIGPKVTIYTANHNFKTGAHAIPYDKELHIDSVEIDENVWIGGNVLLLPGTKLREGVIVGAGSVVTKEIPAYSIVVGNPCKIIGTRNIDEYHKLKDKKSIYLSNKEL